MSARWRAAVAVGLGLAGVVPAGRARAQLFSPGKLARPHEHLEGLSNCTECHQAGDELKDALCLDCHEEIAARVRTGRGFHGRLEPADGGCAECHLDHQGRDFDMVGLDERRFRHDRTGWPLTGAHREVDCADCHDRRLIVDDAVRHILAENPRKRTFLGAATRCGGCHFDEHRGQLSSRCDDCHRTDAWTPAPGFDHAAADFALRGAHADVECEQCHPVETEAPRRSFPAPVRDAFARYAPVEHSGCISCHEDPHRGALGPECASCHVEASWTRIKAEGTKSRAFHQATRYPLVGAHRFVACDACHLPLGARSNVYEGLKFDACADCHLDAHGGQVSARCEDCHTLESFRPTTFGTEAHAETDYPLAGAHGAVACRRCHPSAEPEPPSPRLLRALKRRQRRWLAAGVQLSPRPHEACLDCHDSPHGGQFAQRVRSDGCEDCHRVASFFDLDFDHDVDSDYPLEGAHVGVDCAGCHHPGSDGAVVYRPVSRECAECHADVHGGQFSSAEGDAEGCARCHGVSGFTPTIFDHAASDYPLVGLHADVACASCHPEVVVDERTTVTWFRGVPTACEGCHADFHRGSLPRSQP